jgi:hypothetical protein
MTDSFETTLRTFMLVPHAIRQREIVYPRQALELVYRRLLVRDHGRPG